MPRKQNKKTKQWSKGKILEVTVNRVSYGDVEVELPNGETAKVNLFHSGAWRDQRDGKYPEPGRE